MYIPQWESLADALIRVQTTGLDETQAKRQISSAIADGAIGIHVSVDQSERDIPGKIRTGRSQVRPPPQLRPEDLDWNSSKPHSAWHTGPDPVEAYAILGWAWRPRRIALLELSTNHLIDIFCSASGDSVGTSRASNGVPVEKRTAQPLPSKPASTGGRPAKYDWDAFTRELLRLANTPDGLPDRAATTKHMKEWCVREWGDEPSDSAIRDKITRIYPD
jgi:hypothetical protein